MPVYTYTTFDDPLASGGDGTHAAGINDTGQIVGTYDDAKKTYPQGWKAPRPYLRIVPQPRA